jgi:hypothetical protein
VVSSLVVSAGFVWWLVVLQPHWLAAAVFGRV